MYSSISKNGSPPESIHCAFPVIKETVPQSRLGYSSNNMYDGYPPIMSDGRVITASYQPNAVLNEDILQQNGIQSNWQYRKFMIDHADEIRKENFRESSNDVGYIKRYIDLPLSGVPATVPYLYKSYIDTSRPFGYETSDLKEIYLSKEELDSRRSAPVILSTVNTAQTRR